MLSDHVARVRHEGTVSAKINRLTSGYSSNCRLLSVTAADFILHAVALIGP